MLHVLRTTTWKPHDPLTHQSNVTDLKVGFQAAIRNAMDATHAGHATEIKKLQRTHMENAMHEENRIDCVRCVFLRACVAYFGFLIALQAVRPLRYVCCVRYDNLETMCRPTKMDSKGRFHAAVHNAMDATHAGHATQIKKTAGHAHVKCNRCSERIGCVRCIFPVHALRISGF